MDEALLEAFRATHYLVCLDPSTWADIRVEQPVPKMLQALAGERGWGLITAWNPMAKARADAPNVAAQQSLHEALRQLPDVTILPAIGIGTQWHEPSLFVIGADLATLDSLARQYRQLGYLHGRCDRPAQLRLVD